MNPALATNMINSMAAMQRQLDLINDRMAADPSQLSRNVRRELARVHDGLGECRRALESETTIVIAATVEVTDRERAMFPRLIELLSAKSTSWTQVGETLAAEGWQDGEKVYKKDRLVSLALAAADGKRYARGVPEKDGVTNDAEAALFDLFNLPQSVGGIGGQAPIIRSCYTHLRCYGMVWRFATAQDCMITPVVDDDADLDSENAEADSAE